MFFYNNGEQRGAGRGWSGLDAEFSSFIGRMGGHLRGGPFRGGRYFGHGDLKLVILSMLEERPRHGYDIIKAIEERSGGVYQPSAGTVYPTLTLLEEMGFAQSTPDEGGKRVYEITEAGRQHLLEHRSTVDDIFSRIKRTGAGLTSDAMQELNRSFGRLARATYSQASHRLDDHEFLQGVAKVLTDAATAINALATRP
ncbi:MAG TPA: PadR family transcriptional regulator [Gemmatimonadaceae bacterium]|jgi:DNA-binding PadR family transcriptional regulator